MPLTTRRTWFVFHKLTAPPAAGHLDRAFACRALTRADAHLLDAFDRPRWRDTVALWLADPGVSLFVALYGGQPVAYECVSAGVPDAGPLRKLRLRDDEVLIRDAYALPGYRARGVMRALHAHRNAMLTRLGYCGTVAAVRADRPALLRATYDHLTWKVERLDERRVLGFPRVTIEDDVQEIFERRLRAARLRRRTTQPALDPLPAAA